jgi:hypothetical protein
VLGSLMITLFSRPEGMVVAWGAAIVLLWVSEVWSTRDKTRVTLVLPAGALCAVAIQGAGDEGFVYFAIILLAMIWPPAYLGLKLRQAYRPSDSEAIAATAPKRFGNEPSGTGEGSRTAQWLIGGVVALIVLGATVVAFLAQTGGDTPRITEAQFDRVDLGDSKDEVSESLGGPGDDGSLVPGIDPVAREEPHDVGEQQFSDCWSYSLTGSGVRPGSDAAVCFNSSDEVIYKRVRIA